MILEYTTSPEHGYRLVLRFIKQECLSVVTRKSSQSRSLNHVSLLWFDDVDGRCEMLIA